MPSPYADILDLLHIMPEGDEAAVAAVRARDLTLTKPRGSFGRLEALVEFLARWQGKAPPTLDNPMVAKPNRILSRRPTAFIVHHSRAPRANAGQHHRVGSHLRLARRVPRIASADCQRSARSGVHRFREVGKRGHCRTG